VLPATAAHAAALASVPEQVKTMKRTRSVLGAWCLFVAAIFAAWSLLAFRQSPDDTAVPAPTQAGHQPQAVDELRDADFYGVIKAVDASRGKVNIALEAGEPREESYNLARDVKVQADEPSTLENLSVNTRVGVIVDGESKAVTMIRVEPFRVVAAPKRDTAELNTPFEVGLRVVNASPLPQSFHVMSCSWDEQWKTNAPDISCPSWSCLGNCPQCFTLAPGEGYEKTIPLISARAGRVSFRMGFHPLKLTFNPLGVQSMRVRAGMRTYWSPPIALLVNRAG
jgi:hypothetical protein